MDKKNSITLKSFFSLNQDDHIDWLIEHEEFEKAMAVAKDSERLLKKHNYLAVGKRYLDHLLKQRRYEAAGALCSKLLSRDKKAWEEQVFRWV